MGEKRVPSQNIMILRYYHDRSSAHNQTHIDRFILQRYIRSVDQIYPTEFDA